MEAIDTPVVPSKITKPSKTPEPVSPSDLKRIQTESAKEKAGTELSRLVDEAGEQRLNTSSTLESVRNRLEEIAATLNSEMQFREKKLNFSVDKISNRILFSVTDKESGEVIRQVPPEAVLKVSHNLEALKGVLFDDRY
ncbi:MAG: flagellar protein FlaG [Gammaproteobacteria bacterium]|nr:flagellar protein FlaG [Gammaproteobacteria bacterium]